MTSTLTPWVLLLLRLFKILESSLIINWFFWSCILSLPVMPLCLIRKFRPLGLGLVINQLNCAHITPLLIKLYCVPEAINIKFKPLMLTYIALAQSCSNPCCHSSVAFQHLSRLTKPSVQARQFRLFEITFGVLTEQGKPWNDLKTPLFREHLPS